MGKGNWGGWHGGRGRDCDNDWGRGWGWGGWHGRSKKDDDCDDHDWGRGWGWGGWRGGKGCD